MPSKLSLLCPLVSLECVAKCSPDTATLPLKLEFSPQRLKEWEANPWIFMHALVFSVMSIDQHMFELNLFWQDSSCACISEGKGKQLESIFNTARKCWNKLVKVVWFMNKAFRFMKLLLKNYLLEGGVKKGLFQFTGTGLLWNWGWLCLTDSLMKQLCSLAEVTVQSYKCTVNKEIQRAKHSVM